MGGGSSVSVPAQGWQSSAKYKATPPDLEPPCERVAGDEVAGDEVVAGLDTPERKTKVKEVVREGGEAGPRTPESENKPRVTWQCPSRDPEYEDDSGDDPLSPMSPVGVAEKISKDIISRVWLGGLASTELQMPTALDASVRVGDLHSAEVAKTTGPVRFGTEGDGVQESCGPAAKARYCDPRQRIQVSMLELRLEDLYWVGKTIGRGGFARVRLAQHCESEQSTVLKSIQKRKAGHSYPQFVVEAGIWEMMMKMSIESLHTNVVRYFDLLESPDHYYVVMERLEGLPLASALTASGAKWP
jgi:hypothetical protein